MIRPADRVCIWCGKLINVRQPSYLAATPGGPIVGPLHPTCCEWLARHPRELPKRQLAQLHTVGRVVEKEDRRNGVH
jgi:hypothetical protein